MIPELPVPTKLPDTAPVRRPLVVERTPAPLTTTRPSLVEAPKVLSAMPTLLALTFQLPPPLLPCAGTDSAIDRSSVRAEKFTLMVAAVSWPAVLSWLVGEVAPASV